MSSNFLITGGLVLFAAILGYLFRRMAASYSINSAEQKAKLEIESAKNKAEQIVLDAKNKAVGVLEELKNEEKETKLQLSRLEERLLKKDETLDKKESEIKSRENETEKEIKALQEEKAELNNLKQQAVKKLEEVAGLNREEAKQRLFKSLEDLYKEELVIAAQKLERERREEIEKKGLEIMITSLHRYARSHVADATTSSVNLPNDEIKGKIIGREGRNIKTLEKLTGVEVIIDETPESLTLSSFDPVRREIAKMALEKLIKDGRIQPAKIEEKVEEAKQELDKRMREIGEAAAYELRILDLPAEVLYLLGRLNYRTSYGQNVLIHSIEMAHLAAMIAGELGLNVEVAKRGALLHDIGKAIDHETTGTHVELGRKILKKYGVDEKVIQAMQSHHEEYPFATPESFVVTAVDALSAARPGARRDSIEHYIQRLENLEKIATDFAGVKNAYAISAGREIRVFVTPEKIDDFGALQLARNIATKIESELKYPGEIKVNVIREVKAVEYAR